MKTFVRLRKVSQVQKMLILLGFVLIPSVAGQDAVTTMADTTTAEPDSACPVPSSGTTPLTINNYSGCRSSSGSGSSGEDDDDDDCDCKAVERRVRNIEGQVLALIQAGGGGGSGGGGGGGVGIGDFSRRGIRDCQDIRERFGNETNGVYVIWPPGSSTSFQVYCEFVDSFAYTVIQSRVDESTTFERSWGEYQCGFGTLGPSTNMWLGLDKIYSIVTGPQYRLEIELQNFDDIVRTVNYNSFSIGPESDRYRLKLFQYVDGSPAGDSLSNYHNFLPFSTYDMDNDYAQQNCALEHGGGWWYRDCDNANLNGLYNNRRILTGPTDRGIEWDTWARGESLKSTKMRIARRFQDTLC